MKLLQINLNRSGRAQDLMLQYMRENKIGIALVSEPNRIPRGNWVGDASGLAPIYWGVGETFALVRRGKGYVAIENGNHVLVSTYCSPNVDKEDLKELLEDIENNILISNRRRVIIGGDFNARSKLWDKKYNIKGRILEEWAHKLNMVILNDGEIETCTRAQGLSRVDVTLATEVAARETNNWEVDGATETLSDHIY